MKFEKKLFVQQFLKIALALLITILLLRVYEYIAIASRLFVENALKFELAGLFYDVWLWLQYCLNRSGIPENASCALLCMVYKSNKASITAVDFFIGII